MKRLLLTLALAFPVFAEVPLNTPVTAGTVTVKVVPSPATTIGPLPEGYKPVPSMGIRLATVDPDTDAFRVQYEVRLANGQVLRGSVLVDRRYLAFGGFVNHEVILPAPVIAVQYLNVKELQSRSETTF